MPYLSFIFNYTCNNIYLTQTAKKLEARLGIPLNVALPNFFMFHLSFISTYPENFICVAKVVKKVLTFEVPF